MHLQPRSGCFTPPELIARRLIRGVCCVRTHLCSLTTRFSGRPGQSLESRHEIYGLPAAVNSLTHTSSYLKGQPFRPSGVVNLALWLPDKPDTRITIPHPSLTLKPLIPRYTKQKQPSLASALKSQGMKKKKKKYFRKYSVKEPTACSDFAVL